MQASASTLTSAWLPTEVASMIATILRAGIGAPAGSNNGNERTHTVAIKSDIVMIIYY